MARAHSIFILYNHMDFIVGAWTVKKELTDWLKKQEIPQARFELAYQVFRVRDGAGDHAIKVPWEEIF